MSNPTRRGTESTRRTTSNEPAGERGDLHSTTLDPLLENIQANMQTIVDRVTAQSAIAVDRMAEQSAASVRALEIIADKINSSTSNTSKEAPRRHNDIPKFEGKYADYKEWSDRFTGFLRLEKMEDTIMWSDHTVPEFEHMQYDEDIKYADNKLLDFLCQATENPKLTQHGLVRSKKSGWEAWEALKKRFSDGVTYNRNLIAIQEFYALTHDPAKVARLQVML
jgi:hypothetical protein